MAMLSSDRHKPGAGQLRHKKVAVVGAGAAGLCNAKYLLDAGADVTLYEGGGFLGGLWAFDNDSGTSSAYRTLHINTDKKATAFHDFPMSTNTQYFPHHSEMYAYLNDYADHHGLREKVRFYSKVTSIRPSAQGPHRWEVELSDGSLEGYDSVVVATGHLSDPLYPQFANGFTGESLHSHHYREPLDFANKSVCIVGIGNSACDIASDLALIARRTVVSTRSGVRIVPKLICGVPITRITTVLDRRWVPRGVVRNLVRGITFLVHGRMEKWGLKTPDRLVHPTSNATFLTHVAYQRIGIKPGVTGVSGQRISFSDGTTGDFDVLIMATGYRVSIPIVAEETVRVKHNSVDLYKRIAAVGHPGLYFVGFINPNAGALNTVFEAQARWIVGYEDGWAELPRVDEMDADIRRRRAKTLSTYRDTPRHALEEAPLAYFKELKDDLKMGKRRSRVRPNRGSAKGPSNDHSAPVGTVGGTPTPRS